MNDILSKSIDDRIENLRNICAIQCSNGNWNVNSYMRGMANGLILALAIIENTECKYFEEPDIYIAKTNLMIDVKSTFTLGLNDERKFYSACAKRKYAIIAGYDYQIWLFNIVKRKPILVNLPNLYYNMKHEDFSILVKEELK